MTPPTRSNSDQRDGTAAKRRGRSHRKAGGIAYGPPWTKKRKAVPARPEGGAWRRPAELKGPCSTIIA